MQDKQCVATSESSPWLTYQQLGVRWGGRSAKTIANGISSGKIPLKPVRLYPRADPVVHVSDVMQLEQQARQAAT